MGDTTTSYTPRDFRRVCDQCGLIFNRTRLHRKGPWIFCDICDAPGDRIREEEDAAIARQRPFRILPVPNAKPLTVDSPYDWQVEEAQIFDFIALTAPSRFVGGASDIEAAGAAAMYMADIIIDGTRPAVWLSTARTVLDRCLTYLLSIQYGSGTGVAAVSANPRVGAFLTSGLFLTRLVVQAANGFIRGYQATGTAEYLGAAKRCATFIRRSQCGDLQSPYTTYPNSGTRYHVGGASTALVDATSLFEVSYNLADQSICEFLMHIGAVIGMDATFGDATSTAYFTAATSASLTTMTEEIVSFCETGARDSNHDGSYISGLSTTAPYASYFAGRSDGTGGSAAWVTASTIAVSAITGALAGVYAVNGIDDTVTAMMAWLAAFTSNSANRTSATATQQQIYDAVTGTYDPALCPAVFLNATAPFTEATGSLYALNRLGQLAPILAASSPETLRTSRSTLSPGQRFSTFDLSLRYLGPMGKAGLSLQPHSSVGANTQDVLQAAQFGNIYRYVNP